MRTLGKLSTSFAAAAAIGLTLAACTGSGSNGNSSASPAAAAGGNGCPSAAQNSNVVAPAGYKVCLFAAATTTASHPDNVVVSGSDVFIGWQNITAKDGTDTKTSTITQYTTAGKLAASWNVIGHTDGMRFDPSTHLLWVMCNEDGKPRLYTIDTTTKVVKHIILPPTPHGGGFDDVQIVGGKVFIDASNPTLTAAGKNPNPSLYSVALSGSTAKLTNVLSGQPKATTINLPATSTTLNLTDPDSMMIGPNGELVLDSQGDSEMLFITSPGTPQQSVKVLSVGTQVDDTVFVPGSKGCLLVADNNSGVFSICSTVWVPGSAMTAAPNDSTVIGFVGTLNLSTGQIQPLITGLQNPHGMGWLPR